MQFRCKNCGGNVVYDPVSRHMLCLSCNSQDTEEMVSQEDSYTCTSCGGKLEVNDFTSATKCPYCGIYTIVDEKVRYPYGPDKLLPFFISKDEAAKILKDKFKDKLFCPADFLSKRTLEKLTGDYVPFWLFSYNSTVYWAGTGKKVRSWVSGNTEYTETKTFDVVRNFNVGFDEIPVDASIPMPDDIMDLMEPYDYRHFIPYEDKYMSGFHAETYNMPPDELEKRAITKADRDTEQWLSGTLTGYNTLIPNQKTIKHTPSGRTFAMMPVWKYVYRFRGVDYEYYVNGQTGKVYGKHPKSLGRIFFVAGSMFGVFFLLAQIFHLMLEVF